MLLLKRFDLLFQIIVLSSFLNFTFLFENNFIGFFEDLFHLFLMSVAQRGLEQRGFFILGMKMEDDLG